MGAFIYFLENACASCYSGMVDKEQNMNPFALLSNFLVANMDLRVTKYDELEKGLHESNRIKDTWDRSFDIPKGSLIYISRYTADTLSISCYTPDGKHGKGKIPFSSVEDGMFSLTDETIFQCKFQKALTGLGNDILIQYFEKEKEPLYEVTVNQGCDNIPRISTVSIQNLFWDSNHAWHLVQRDFAPFGEFPDHPLKDIFVSLDILYLCGWIALEDYRHIGTQKYTLFPRFHKFKDVKIVPFHNGYLEAHKIVSINASTIAKTYFKEQAKKAKV